MNVVILHCHFERGGVTQVVENHIDALRADGSVDSILLVSGSRVSGLSPGASEAAQGVILDDFDYERDRPDRGSAESRGDALYECLTKLFRERRLDPAKTVLHWHNHSLGKNTAAPRLIRRLAESGWRLLLQIHDFAEDNRPANVRRLVEATAAAGTAELDRYLYPVASQIHYATLTGADGSVLGDLGVPGRQTHCLPNSVGRVVSGAVDRERSLARIRRAFGLSEASRWCLYPVRGIRRKNVGEFLLLCRWLPEGMRGGLTLRPTTPVEARSYDRWKDVAAAVAPAAIFDAAHHPEVTYADNLAASDYVISTSVAEGFGMAYLEPWLAGRGVIARRLPTVMSDFEAVGMQFPLAYESIAVPGSPSWLHRVRDEAIEAERRAWLEVPPAFRPTVGSLDGQPHRDTWDFARLTPSRQVEVLRRAAADPEYDAELKRRSADLVAALRQPVAEQVIRRNAAVVSEVYSRRRAGADLLAIYRAVLSSPVDLAVEGPKQAGRAVDLVSEVRPFFPCRTETFPDVP